MGHPTPRATIPVALVAWVGGDPMHRLAFVLALFSSLLVASWLRPASGATGLETAFVSNTETVPLDPPARDLPKAGPDWDPNG